MKPRNILLTLALVALAAGSAAGDWLPGDPNTKWVQMPDLSYEGLDVRCTSPVVVADDWECTEPSLLTDVHIWASWKFDYLPFETDPMAVDFILRVYSDVPAGMPGPDGLIFEYSRPGDLLWERPFMGLDVIAQPWEQGLQEGWYDPSVPEYYWPGDTVCWQYNFMIPKEEAFLQEGTAAEPKVYWISVEAIPQDPQATFGWKTSQDHWNDDSVWFDPTTSAIPPQELIHPELQYSLDQAFALTFEPVETNVKWSQAPDLSDSGLDVRCTDPIAVADDWECTERSLLTDVHIWASWKFDYLPFETDPSAVDFILRVYDDVPANTPGPWGVLPYSTPGNLLWEWGFPAGAPTVQIWAENLQEGWYDPWLPEYYWPGDSICWRYDFYIPPEVAFLQDGSAEQPLVYWISVEALPHDQSAVFGWKTSLEHWNDDSVWFFPLDPSIPPQELFHPELEFSLDQAFELTFQPWVTGLGDYSGDGEVDTVDYVVWADHFNQPKGTSFAPGSYVGLPTDTVNIADYTVWADRFGNDYDGPGH